MLVVEILSIHLTSISVFQAPYPKKPSLAFTSIRTGIVRVTGRAEQKCETVAKMNRIFVSALSSAGFEESDVQSEERFMRDKMQLSEQLKFDKFLHLSLYAII